MSYLDILKDSKHYVSSEEEKEVLIKMSKSNRYGIDQKSSLHTMLKFFDEKWRNIKISDPSIQPQTKVNLNVIKKQNKINKGMFSFHKHSKLIRRDGKVVKNINDDFKEDERTKKNKPRKMERKQKKMKRRTSSVKPLTNQIDEIILTDSMINVYRSEFFSDLKKLCEDDLKADNCSTPVNIRLKENNELQGEKLENEISDSTKNIDQDEISHLYESIDNEVHDLLLVAKESLRYCQEINKSYSDNANMISNLQESLNSIIKKTDKSKSKNNSERVIRLW